MRWTELFGHLHKICFVHAGMCKVFVCFGKFLFSNREIGKYLISKALRPLAVKALNQRYTFLPGNFTVADLLGRIVGSTPNAEFYESSVVVEIIYFIVNIIV